MGSIGKVKAEFRVLTQSGVDRRSAGRRRGVVDVDEVVGVMKAVFHVPHEEAELRIPDPASDRPLVIAVKAL